MHDSGTGSGGSRSGSRIPAIAVGGIPAGPSQAEQAFPRIPGPVCSGVVPGSGRKRRHQTRNSPGL